MPHRVGPSGVTVPPPSPAGLASALRRNIQALQERRLEEDAAGGSEARIAEAITSFVGSMRFVYLHLVLFGLWALVNLGILPLVAPFDPTFVILATTASVEAIFLSTFVLISQNRASAAADKRADLDLQITLLTEHEVTKIVTLTAAIAAKLGVDEAHNAELAELGRDVAPEAVLDELEKTENAARAKEE